jgi:hypothetical protein
MLKKFSLLVELALVSILLLILTSCGSGGGSSGGNTQDQVEAPPTEVGAIVDWKLDNPAPRGIGSLALGVPTFPREAYLEVIAVLKNNFTNHLWDFPEASNKDLVYNFLAELRGRGHTIVHEIYVVNGPGIRGGRSRLANSLAGKTVEPEEFDKLVRTNQQFRFKLRAEFVKVVEFSKLLEQLGIEVLICPVLEDNLSDSGFNSVVTLLVEAGWDNTGEIVREKSVVRNGEGDQKPTGVRREIHPKSVGSATAKTLAPGDIINTDGKTFTYADEAKSSKQFSIDEVKFLIQYSEDRQVLFSLWEARLQGRMPKPDGSYPYIGSDVNRTYLLDRPEELKKILLLQ